MVRHHNTMFINLKNTVRVFHERKTFNLGKLFPPSNAVVKFYGHGNKIHYSNFLHFHILGNMRIPLNQLKRADI
jgi:hypothetical protein